MIATSIIVGGTIFLAGVALGVAKKSYESKKEKNKSGKA